jgi:[acyl-carrier-protein] S-malonyltransferase
MKKVVFLIPGQGAQYAGMGKEICEKYPEVESIYDIANEILKIDIKRMCFEGAIDELTRTENTQVAVFLTSIAAFRAMKSRYDFESVCFAGHSLGEFAALVCAESIDLEAAISLVRKRGQLMQEISEDIQSKMVAIRNISVQEIEKHCKIVSEKGKTVGIANYNSSNQIVVSGYKEAVEEVVEVLRELGAEDIAINVKSPFHTILMEAAAKEFEVEVKKYEFKTPKCEVISNLTGKPYEKTDNIAEMLVKQITNPVRWIQTMEYIKEVGADLVIDIGPKDIVKKLALSNGIKIPAYAISNNEDLKELKLRVLSPKTIVSFVSKALGIAVALKNYNNNLKEYEAGVIKPYRKIEQIKQVIQGKQGQISESEIKEILMNLNTIFKTKGTPEEERTRRVKALLELVPKDINTKNLLN